MSLNRKISTLLVANLLGLALLFPIAIQFIHSVSSHEHTVCYDHTTHLHEDKFECSIFEFHISKYTYTPLDLPELHIFGTTHHLESLYLQVEFKANILHYNLRGPPLLS